jgi:hypothetical protein
MLVLMFSFSSTIWVLAVVDPIRLERSFDVLNILSDDGKKKKREERKEG